MRNAGYCYDMNGDVRKVIMNNEDREEKTLLFFDDTSLFAATGFKNVDFDLEAPVSNSIEKLEAPYDMNETKLAAEILRQAGEEAEEMHIVVYAAPRRYILLSSDVTNDSYFIAEISMNGEEVKATLTKIPGDIKVDEISEDDEEYDEWADLCE